jgi:methylenetetrahydrofolate reductase (NADPH)
MISISIELVPRSYEEISVQISEIQKQFPLIDTLNIPDLLRFPVRSWEACKHGLHIFQNVIPHLRAIDFNLRDRFELTETFIESTLKSALVITGDKPQDMSKKVYRNSSLELIRVLKKEMPHLKVYAGIDPYRSSLSKELDYIKDKLDAGVDGFFTQPFFDIRLLDMYMEYLDGHCVYWGICPVTSEKSKSYWESKNEAMFPKAFDHSYSSNVELARIIIKRAQDSNTNIYIMPIRIEPFQYLKEVLSD